MNMAATGVLSFSSGTGVLSTQEPFQLNSCKDAGKVRHCTDFPPSNWSSHFSESSQNDSDYSSLGWVEGLKAEIGEKLDGLSDKPMQQLKMIDAIQQLGLSYHFKQEMKQALETIFAIDMDLTEYDLHHASLYFRLFRQSGYHVSSGIFSKYLDSSGGLKEELLNDVHGMMSFYEAGELLYREDAVLHEAVKWCVIHLRSIAGSLSPSLNAQVIDSIKQSIFKNIPRLLTRKYISMFQEDESHDRTLLRLAKLDYNLVQKCHQQEIRQISKWWKDLGLPSHCPYARERRVESYTWSLAMYFEPQYSLPRKILCKIFTFLTVLDDTYDAYGTSEELELLTEAIKRWDSSLLGQMPAYMRALYQALLDIYAELEDDMVQQGTSYRMHYLKEVMKNQARAYHDEYLWLKNSTIPTMEEYMQVGKGTSTVTFIVAMSLAGMGESLTQEAFEWVLSEPKMLKACSAISRLRDDIVTHKFEQLRGHAPSAVECYMHQHGVSETETYKELNKQVSDAWRDMNEGCLQPTVVPFEVLERVLNFARCIDVVYKDGDGFTHCKEYLDDKVALLLVDPIPI